ncbi:MAG: chorismate-binding protein [Saprospiraceae bacterium]|nr:chorismate-binding protein [Saprospiraceae bacterium]MCB9322203.1 chorismate-binding protein [Lewinellaceae bacterium]
MNTLSATKIKIKGIYHKTLADTNTPVSLFLKLRDHYTDPVLLESNDFKSREDCRSFIGLDAMATFEVQNGEIRISGNAVDHQVLPVTDLDSVPDALQAFIQQFEVDYEQDYPGLNGLFGHCNFDAIQYFESLKFEPAKRRIDLPDLRYSFYRFVISINHFKDEMLLLENLLPGEASEMDRLLRFINGQKFSTHNFKLKGRETSNLTDEAFKELVVAGKHHCQVGDVFQIVFSRQFSHGYEGDDFNVYRVLRSINPSPYLFYFDYGSYRIFGSSPETQMQIEAGIARVNPIAGTYKRTGDSVDDALRAIDLAKDPKENAEHIMLVDLARNDLGRHASNIQVKQLKAIQFFSHVIHLVSKVEGELDPSTNPIRVFGDTFPAGTLSGAPKYKAIQLINTYENQNRSFYGGALGFIDLSGNMNQAIVIRSFLSMNNKLYYQAGAGIVVDSNEENELQEVNNKLGALKKALLEAENI